MWVDRVGVLCGAGWGAAVLLNKNTIIFSEFS